MVAEDNSSLQADSWPSVLDDESEFVVYKLSSSQITFFSVLKLVYGI